MAVWVEDGLGLVGRETLGKPCVQFCFLCILIGKVGAARGGHNIMRAKIQRSEEINGDFTIETKTIKTDGLDFFTRLVQNLDLVRSKRVRKVQAGWQRMENRG